MVGLRPQARTFRRHRSTDPSTRFRRKPLFEALEPRLLLSADLGSAAIVDALANQPVQTDGVTPQTIITSSIPLLITPADGGPATLRAGNTDNIWRITGADQVTLNGVAYDNVGTLIGGEHNEDTFIFEPNGSLSGYLDGNVGGFDTLVIEGGAYTNTEYTASGPDSGTVTLDGKVIRYFGLEPVANTGTAANARYTLTANADDFDIEDAVTDGQITIDSNTGTFEDTTFNTPTSSLLVNAGNQNDVINVDLFEIEMALTVDAGAGDDIINFSTLFVNRPVIIDGGAGTDTA